MNERLTLPVLPLREVVLFPGVTAPIGAGRPGTLRAIEAALTTPEKLVFAVAQRDNVGERQRRRALHDRHHRPDRPDAAGPGRRAAAAAGRAPRHRDALLREGRLSRGRGASPPRRWRRSTRTTRRSWPSTGGAGARRRAGREVRPARGGGPAGARRRRRSRPVRRPGGRLHRPHARPSGRACSRRSRSRSGCAACWCTCSGRSACSTPRKTSSRRSRKSWASGSARCSCASSSRPSSKELGEDDEVARDLEELREKLDALDLPEEARAEVERELGRLERIGRESMESQVIRTYLETSRRAAVEHAHRRPPRPRRGGEDPRRGSLRARGREGPRARVPRRAAAARRRSRAAGRQRTPSQGTTPRRSRAGPDGTRRHAPIADRGTKARAMRTDPALRRPAGRRQDVDRQVDRARDGPQVRAHLARRRARRGRHPRPPPHLRRCHAGPHHPGHEAGRHQEPRLPARRGGQAGRVVPGRSGGGAARGARSGAERLLHRSLSRRAVRPERGAVHRHGELHPEHPRSAARPHGGGGVRRLHRAGEARDRAEVPDPAPARRERARRATDRDHRRRRSAT